MSLKWDKRFLDLAKHVSEWSKDPSTKVGAVITDPMYRIISVGFNGFPRGVEDTHERLNTREIKYDLVIHAEINAILFANEDVKGFTLYTWPLPPCVRCATQIIQRGISRVVSPVYGEGRWKESCASAKSIMQEAGLEVIEID